jgi:hypothetical protein
MISTLKLVEKQIAMLELRRRLEEVRPQPGRYVTAEGVAFGPCLLISRECGSGGSALGEEIGNQLNWNVFDQEIVDEIAQISHIHRRLVESADERIHSRWEQTWREMLLDDLPDKVYFFHLKQVVITLGQHGNVVLVGRGAHYLLPSRCALRVRLVAPREIRARRLAERYRMSLSEAYERMDRTDLERKTFTRKVYERDSSLPADYDLVINTGRFKPDELSELVLAAMKEKLGVDVPRGGKRAEAAAAGPSIMVQTRATP